MQVLLFLNASIALFTVSLISHEQHVNKHGVLHTSDSQSKVQNTEIAVQEYQHLSLNFASAQQMKLPHIHLGFNFVEPVFKDRKLYFL